MPEKPSYSLVIFVQNQSRILLRKSKGRKNDDLATLAADTADRPAWKENKKERPGNEGGLH
jgi:antitoxin component of MazEF toxin-antitoxin module